MDICFDVGGTFTDIVVRDTNSDFLHIEKLLTETVRNGAAIPSVIRNILQERNLDPIQVNSLIHATTLPSNMIIERSGERVGMIVNRGFRDILELGFESRFDLYNFNFPTVKPMVPRQDRFEVSARILSDGSVELPVDEDEVQELVLLLELHSIHSVAVCLLHSYRFPEQEVFVEYLLRKSGYTGHIELSSRICPEIREYPRMSTTVLNAYITPMMALHIDTLAVSLKRQEINRTLNLMTSHGGRLPAQIVRSRSVELLESGAAATVVAAAEVAKSLQLEHVLSFEMGGTTAKTAVVLSGTPNLIDQYEVARIDRSKPGSGLPVQMPAIDLIEIGAGGGSIASLNQVGLVTVGPESAGSNPGPACYGKGGIQPTVTDACMMLDYLNPEGFLDGSFPLERCLAEQSIKDVLTSKTGGDPKAAAEAVFNVTVEMMANTARVHLLEHGLDPEAFTLIASGGAGPLFAAALAAQIGITQVIVMPHAGVGSAIGMLNAPPSVRLSRSRLETTASVDRDNIFSLIGEMHKEALGYLIDQDLNEVEMHVSCKMRYRGQGHEITVPIDAADFSSDLEDQLHTLFEAAYLARYGRILADASSEIVGWQLVAIKSTSEDKPIYLNGKVTIEEQAKTRRARFSGQDLEVRVLKRELLNTGQKIEGPVIVEERETSTIVPPEGVLSLDRYGNLVIDLNIE
jgi:N-methylhydantoinase A